jgi:hypothetical protein
LLDVFLIQQDALLEVVEDAGFEAALAAKQPVGELRLAQLKVWALL